MSGVVGQVKAWIDEPFTTPLDVAQLFWLVGIVLVLIVFWNLILFHIRIAAERAV